MVLGAPVLLVGPGLLGGPRLLGGPGALASPAGPRAACFLGVRVRKDDGGHEVLKTRHEAPQGGKLGHDTLQHGDGGGSGEGG